MTTEELSRLCTDCGLCCYAFHNLGLIQNDKEKKTVENFGGELFYNKAGKLSFRQPCPAYNGICTVYPNHPISCKNYECKLLRMVKKKEMGTEKAEEIIRKIKVEIDLIDKTLTPLLGRRTVIVDDYISEFFEKLKENTALKKEYQSLLIHFGIYQHLRLTYFDI